MTDYAFKLVFGVKKNIANTEAFLKTVLDLPEDEYKGLTIKNPFLNRFRRKGKQGGSARSAELGSFAISKPQACDRNSRRCQNLMAFQ